MTRPLISLAALFALAAPSFAQEAAPAPPSPAEIVDQAPAEEWVAISPEDLLVMTLAPAADGSERKVVIQLMPAPFSQGWVENIRTLARANWYDGISVNRVQDNYVVQWGDPNYDNPEADGPAKPLPEGLQVPNSDAVISTPYTLSVDEDLFPITWTDAGRHEFGRTYGSANIPWPDARNPVRITGPYASSYGFNSGFPFALGFPYGLQFRIAPTKPMIAWPVHCYGMVGVGRGMSPDTGTGAELYTVIGHAPRHLDRNIALVGRVVEGIEHLSSLPRGKGQLGFYEDEAMRTPILTVRVAADLPASERPSFEYLATDGASFARYAEARANRRDPFFIVPAGGADICNIPVPVRRTGSQ